MDLARTASGDIPAETSDQKPAVPTWAYQALFEKTPIIGYAINREMRIVAMTDRCVKASSFHRPTVIGADVFETFPDNPDDPSANGTKVLRESLERAFATGMPEKLPRQRYDARPTPDAPFRERYWLPENVPVLDDAGNVVYVIHTIVRG